MRKTLSERSSLAKIPETTPIEERRPRTIRTRLRRIAAVTTARDLTATDATPVDVEDGWRKR
jgi:hypothetical protein